MDWLIQTGMWVLSNFIWLHGLGWVYAWYIDKWPIRPTWISVMIGTGAICLAEMLAIGGTLFIFGLFRQLWFMILYPPLYLITAGGPMAVIQQRKWREQQEKVRNVEEVWTKELDG